MEAIHSYAEKLYGATDWPDGTEALSGLQALLNYTAGAMIYVRREYSDRINILRASWIAAPCTVQVTVRWRFIPERELPLFAIVWVCFCFCSAA